MKMLLINWCRLMFQRTDGVIRVRTASCQNGALCARLSHASQMEENADKVIVSSYNLYQDSSVNLEENTIFLNRREVSFINKEVRLLLKAQQAQLQARKKQGIPLPPQPGKITYAVYQ